jgi:hypothetical protein
LSSAPLHWPPNAMTAPKSASRSPAGTYLPPHMKHVHNTPAPILHWLWLSRCPKISSSGLGCNDPHCQTIQPLTAHTHTHAVEMDPHHTSAQPRVPLSSAPTTAGRHAECKVQSIRVFNASILTVTTQTSSRLDSSCQPTKYNSCAMTCVTRAQSTDLKSRPWILRCADESLCAGLAPNASNTSVSCVGPNKEQGYG